MRCYFHLVRTAEYLYDEIGFPVEDIDQVRIETDLAIARLRAEQPSLFEVGPGWHLLVIDDAGHPWRIVRLDCG